MAVSFLRRRGYRILERNYSCSYGEVDLVAEESGDIVFVEVKTRAGVGYGEPAEAVTIHKQRQIMRVAEHYRIDKKLGGVPCRFDVVSIVAEPGKKPVFKLYSSAFDFRGWRT